MTKFRNVLIAVALGAVAMFSSCKKDAENSDLVLDNYNTGKVTCIIEAVYEFGEDPEKVPDGTQVVFEAPYKDFNANIKTGNVIKVFTVSGGKVVADLEAPSAGVEYQIRVVGFEHDYDNGSDSFNYLFDGNGSETVKPYDNKALKITCTHKTKLED